MKPRRFLTPLIIFILLVTGLFRNVCASDENAAEDLIRRYKQETKCECVSVVVFENGAVTYYGDSGKLFQIGSMTKAFTGLAVQKLINEGLINEDAAVSDYIPGFEAFYDSERVDITVRNLLEQKSGYTNNEKDYPSASETMTLSEWTESISGRELKSKPGTEYAYSNVNFNLLGRIIENVSGMSYRDYMEQEILVPLGLKNTFVGMPAKRSIERGDAADCNIVNDNDANGSIAEGGTANGGIADVSITDGGFPEVSIAEGTRLGYRHVFDFPIAVREATIPAGYFYSNTEDMGRWIEIWTGSGDLPDDYREALSKIKECLKEEGDYYSGWELFADGVIGHSGGTPNYSSRIVFDEKTQTGVCVLCNLNVAASTDSLCNSIMDVVSGKAPGGLSKDIWTIFDLIFTAVTVMGILLLVLALILKTKLLLIFLDVILAVLLALVFILFPMIFGAGMKEILFTWAPWSLTGGLLSLIADICVATVKLVIVTRSHGSQ